jgi:hypothetical protein
MKFNLKPSTNCVKCGNKLSLEYKRALTDSEFSQSWCLLCLLKYGESYPTTRDKIETIQQVNNLQRKYKF